MIPTPNVEDKITVGNARLDGPMNSVPVIETRETIHAMRQRKITLLKLFKTLMGRPTY